MLQFLCLCIFKQKPQHKQAQQTSLTLYFVELNSFLIIAVETTICGMNILEII